MASIFPFSLEGKLMVEEEENYEKEKVIEDKKKEAAVAQFR